MEVFQSSVIFAIVVQGTLFISSRLHKTNKLLLKDWFLILFLTNLILHFLSIYVFQFGFTNTTLKLHGVFSLAYGPLLWLILKLQYNKDNFLSVSELLHFIPSLLVLIYLFANHGSINADKTNLIRVIVFLQIFLYLVLMAIKINFAKKQNKIKLEWLNWILPIFTLLIILAFTDYLRWKFHLPINSSLTFTLLLVIALVLTSGFIHYGLLHHLLPQNLSKIEPFSNKTNTKKLLTENEKVLIMQQIYDFFNQEKPYLECSLTIKDVSKKLDIPVYKISLVVNDILSQNFSDFVNTYRIETAKDLLLKTDVKILAIAFDSGFANKSNFNRVFKKFVKLSPTDYKNLYSN